VVDGADHTFMQLKHRRVLMRMFTGPGRAALFGEQVGVATEGIPAAPRDLALRRATRSDQQPILAFYRLYHAQRQRLQRADVWAWKYPAPAEGAPFPVFLLEAGGEVQGSISYVPRVVEHGGAKLSAAFPVDYFVVPECRGLPAARLLRAVLAEREVLIAVYVSQAARRVLKAAGFSDMSHRLRSYHYGLVPSVRSARSMATALLRALARAGRKLARRLATRRYAYKVSGEVDAPFVDRLRPESPPVLRKDAAWFQWRYAASPELSCRYLYQSEPSGPVAFAAVAVNERQRQLLILDVCAGRNDALAMIGLVDEIIDLARSSGCRIVTTHAAHASLHAALKFCLFRDVTSDLGMFVKARDAQLQRALVESPHWNFMLGDSDAV
jgi:hypothetical protein